MNDHIKTVIDAYNQAMMAAVTLEADTARLQEEMDGVLTRILLIRFHKATAEAVKAIVASI